MKAVKWFLKRKILMLCLMAVIFTANAQNVSYINDHKLMTSELAAQFGIPYSVILAVALVESSAGQGRAATRLNNHFGMVGRNHLKAKGYHSRYKQYNNEQESFLDFCHLISRKQFYPILKDNTDPKEWVKAISKAGYSTEPAQWQKKVLTTIEKNQL